MRRKRIGPQSEVIGNTVLEDSTVLCAIVARAGWCKVAATACLRTATPPGLREGFREDQSEWLSANLLEMVSPPGPREVRLILRADQEGWHNSCERGCARDDYGQAGPFSVAGLKMDLPFCEFFAVYKQVHSDVPALLVRQGFREDRMAQREPLEIGNV